MFAFGVPATFYRVVRLFSRRPASSLCALSLRDGDVLRLDAGPHAWMTCRVTHGTIWLTATPADGDTILRAGDRVTLTRAWPVIVQAMGDDAGLEVTRSS
jgi:hypothetical protein